MGWKFPPTADYKQSNFKECLSMCTLISIFKIESANDEP